MISQNFLKEVIADQDFCFRKKDQGILRDLNFSKYHSTKQIVVISGPRRAGKSTLLRQFAQSFPEFYYITFDDERFIDFKVEDFQQLMIAFKQRYESHVIFIDEIQNIDNWERFVRRLYEEGFKIFITGSNANLLSSELATHLTGRYFKIELYPFSFKEFLKFKKNIDLHKKDSGTKASILKLFNRYLNEGGFPEFIKYDDSEYLKRIYEDIIYKDLLVRYKIREVKAFRVLANFLFTNFTKKISYNSLKNVLGFKSVMSVKNYIEFMKESYLIYELYSYDFSLKKQIISDKKCYVIDNGLRNHTSFSFSDDKGRLLENLVFLELKRRNHEIFYFKKDKECDFIIKERGKIITAIQVVYEMDLFNREREINGLLEPLKEFGLKKGLLLTESQEEKIKISNKTIEVLPVYKFLLGIS